MGQPGSPIINRVGLFQHWEATYYSDRYSAELINQDRILRQYIKTILSVGEVDIRDLGTSNYGEEEIVRNVFPTIDKDDEFVQNLCFREFSCLDFYEKRDLIHLARRPLPNVYFFKLGLFRYQSGLVIVCLFYKPLSKRQQKRLAPDAVIVSKHIASTNYGANINHGLRVKLFIAFTATKLLTDAVKSTGTRKTTTTLLF